RARCPRDRSRDGAAAPRPRERGDDGALRSPSRGGGRKRGLETPLPVPAELSRGLLTRGEGRLLVLVDGEVDLGLAGDALRVLARDRRDEVVFGLVDVRRAHALLLRRAVAEVPLAPEGAGTVLERRDGVY